MTTRQIVHDILGEYPDARNDDKKLLQFYKLRHTQDTFADDFIENNFEFIRDFIRERAIIQNKMGLYKPSEGARKARRKKEAKIVEVIREEKKNFASHIYNYAKRIIRNK